MRHSNFGFTLFLLTIFLTVLLALPTQAQDSISKDLEVTIDSIDGDVEVQFQGKEYQPAEQGMKLKMGDYVATGFESTCTLRFQDTALMTVKEMTNLAIAQFYIQGNLAKSAVSLRTGEVTTKVKPSKGVRADFKIETPTSTVAVRGTENTIRTIEGFGTLVGGHSGVTDVINRIGQRTTVRQAERAQVLPETNAIESNLQLVRMEAESPIIDYGRTEEETRAIIDINPNVQLPQSEISEVINTLPKTSTLELHWNFENVSTTTPTTGY